MNCVTCIPFYYPLEDKTTLSHTHADPNRPNYYYNAAISKFSLCYTSCLTCSAAGPVATHNCNKCTLNFYILSDVPLQCFSKLLQMYHLTMSLINFGWNKCYFGCAMSTAIGNINTLFCINAHHYIIL